MRFPLWVLTLVAGLATVGAAALSTTAVGDEPDLVLALALDGGGSTRLVGADVLVEATVTNGGDGPAASFLVDVWCSVAGWGRHTLSFPTIPPGANASVVVTTPFIAQWNGLVLFSGLADPAGALGETDLTDNADTLGVQFVSIAVLEVGSRLASTTPLDEGDVLVFRVDLRDGESVLFQADTEAGHLRFDQYLLDEENWGNYQAALTNASSIVTYFADGYSTIDTNHVAFSTSPLPGGAYYLVLDNGAVLEHGAMPNGEATVVYSVARVGGGLPIELVVVVLAATVAAVVATLRWRPAFQASAAVHSVPKPKTELDVPNDAVESAEAVKAGADGTTGGPLEAPPRPPRN